MEVFFYLAKICFILLASNGSDSIVHDPPHSMWSRNVSTHETVTCDVPQGSVLGPLLFICYINDITRVIRHSQYFLYADDLAIVVSGKDPIRISSLIQEDLNSISDWCFQNKLTINTEKTHVLWLYSPRSIPNLSQAGLRLNCRTLSVVKEFNYLGVKVDTHLTLCVQLKKQINLMRSCLYQLHRLRARSDQPTALLVYKQILRPITDYGAFMAKSGPVWAANKLQTLQNDCLRACEQIRDPRDAHVNDLHTRNHVVPLQVTRDRQLLCLMHKWSKDHTNVVVPPRLLRGNNKIRLKHMRVKKDIYSKSPLYRGVPLWNDLDPNTQSIEKTAAFISALKG